MTNSVSSRVEQATSRIEIAQAALEGIASWLTNNRSDVQAGNVRYVIEMLEEARRDLSGLEVLNF